ncbi:hypothetical protein [Ilumatobacter sp.]|uniref:hypothetical protein n=1 Tax=Ilumatobacter sp. TaxID=1967498 RepID=UPI003B52BE0C
MGASDLEDPTSRRAGAPAGTGAALTRRVPEIVLAIAAVALLVEGSLHRPLVTPDYSAYLSIAEHWAGGDLDEAINGYWSPLYPWLLAPFLRIGVAATSAQAILAVGIAVATTDRLRALVHRTVRDPATSRAAIEVLLVGTIPFQLWMALSLDGADHLLSLLVAGAFAAALDDRRCATRRGLEVGAWTSLGFLTKVFALPFSIAFVVIWVVVSWALPPPTRTTPEPPGERSAARAAGGWWRSGATALGVLAAVAIGWSVVLSVSFGTPTFNQSATYHARITAPGAQGNPFDWAGLLRPTGAEAVSAWENPSTATLASGQRVDLDERAVDGDGRELVVDGRVARFVTSVRKAASTTSLLAGTVIAAALTAAAVALVALRRIASTRRPTVERGAAPVLIIAASAAAYVVGISLAVVNDRYLWPPLLLSVPVAAHGVDRLVRRVSAGRAPARTTAVALAAVVAVVSLPWSLAALAELGDDVSETERESLPAVAAIEQGERVATSVKDFDYLGICFAAGCTYWGTPIESSGDALLDELCAARIDLLVVEGDAPGAVGSVDLDRVEVRSELVDSTILDVRAARGRCA